MSPLWRNLSVKKSNAKPVGSNDNMDDELRSRRANPPPKTKPRIRRRYKSPMRIVDAFEHEKPRP